MDKFFKALDYFHYINYFQLMMKMTFIEKNMVGEAVEALCEAIRKVPAVTVEAIEREARSANQAAGDVALHIRCANRPYTLLGEVKSNGQPRHARIASLLLRDRSARTNRNVIPVFIAPYLSLESRAICQKYDVGFLDLMGNMRIVFDTVFIDREVADKPISERRNLRSVFSPRAARMIRIMLWDPSRPWRVQDLASAADISIGHVSNVRKALIDREWAGKISEGVFLSDPDALLDAWRDNYKGAKGQRHGYYTLLHGKALDNAAQKAFRQKSKQENMVFASFSAARWLAPYAWIGTDYFYADAEGMERLREALKLTPVSRGENVVIRLPKDMGIFLDSIEPARNILCTSDAQTYLDLYASGERGVEAAEHLRKERLKWRDPIPTEPMSC